MVYMKKGVSRIITLTLALVFIVSMIPPSLVSDFIDKAYAGEYNYYYFKSTAGIYLRKGASGGKPGLSEYFFSSHPKGNNETNDFGIPSQYGTSSPIKTGGGCASDLPIKLASMYHTGKLTIKTTGVYDKKYISFPTCKNRPINLSDIRAYENSEVPSITNGKSHNWVMTATKADGKWYDGVMEWGNTKRVVDEMGRVYSKAIPATDPKVRGYVHEKSRNGVVWSTFLSGFTPSDASRMLGSKDNMDVVITCWLGIKGSESDDDDSGGGDSGGGGGGDPIGPGDDDDDDDYIYIPEPEPEPVPSVARVSISGSVSSSKSTFNYKKDNPSLSASVTANDISQYNDVGTLVNTKATVNSSFGSASKTTSSGTTTAEVSAKFSDVKSELSKLNPVQYKFGASGSGKVKLTNGSASGNWPLYERVLTMANEKPNTSIKLKTDNINGGPVQEGYYYTNRNTKLTAIFEDYESDMYDISLYIATKENWENNVCNYMWEVGQSNTNAGSSNSLFEVKNISPVNSLYGNRVVYTADVVFKQPGNYVVASRVRDINNKSIRDYIGQYDEALLNGAGTTNYIEVRDEPKPPKAIISSPNYAYENLVFNVRQASTDPNNDIVKWTWTNPVDVTKDKDPEFASSDDFKNVTPSSNLSSAGKNGGQITFPTGSLHHHYKITLNVKDATNFTDNTEQVIRIISYIPVAVPEILPEDPVDPVDPTKDPDIPDNPDDPDDPDEPEPYKPIPGGNYYPDPTNLKVNRKITLTGANSLAPSNDPIDWSRATWTVKAVRGGTLSNVHKEIYNNNKNIKLQFDKVGVYDVTLKLYNNFSTSHPNDEDIGASEYTTRITVVEDKKPITSVKITSGDPVFNEDGSTQPHTVSFKVDSSSIDGDLLPTNTPTYAKRTYRWQIYEDKLGDGNWKLIPESRRTYNPERTEVSVKTSYGANHHSNIKAVVTTVETFGEPYEYTWLARDGSWQRRATTEVTYVANWTPKIYINPPGGEDPSDPDPNPDPDGPDGPNTGTASHTEKVYDDTDIDGDGLTDGKFIRIYPDDILALTTTLYDEFKDNVQVEWQLSKKNHSNSFDSGWINNSAVTKQLNIHGGTIKITSPGIYKLKAIIKDDYGLSTENEIMIRVYSMPIAVLESNPEYLYYEDEWTTKENVRFDLRSNPTIVDDEWGVAWHQMNWNLDSWTITGKYTQEVADSPYRQETAIPLGISKQGLIVSNGQKIEAADEVHVMNPQFTQDETNNTQASSPANNVGTDKYTYSEHMSPIGFGTTSGAMLDIVAITGLTSVKDYKYYEDGREYYGDQDTTKVTEALQKIKSELEAANPKYDIRVYNASTVTNAKELFRKVTPYGYFDGFVDTADAEQNRYTVAYITEYKDSSGMAGTTYLAGNIKELTKDKNGKECQIGEVRILDGYDPDVYKDASNSEKANLGFKGSAKVYAAVNAIPDEILNMADGSEKNSKIKEIFKNSSWTEIASYGSGTTDWSDKLVATMKRVKESNGVDTWTISSADGKTSIHCTQDKHVFFKVEFVGDSDGKHHTAAVIRGIGGIYEDSYNYVTRVSTIQKTLESIGTRGQNAPKVIVYITSVDSRLQEINSSTNLATDPVLADLKEYLLNRGKTENIHLLIYNPCKDATSYFTEGLKGKQLPNYGIESVLLTDVKDYASKLNTVSSNDDWRAFSFTEPGEYKLTYIGTNYRGKSSKPVTYTIKVKEDLPPEVLVEPVSPKWYRDKQIIENGKKVFITTISLTGPNDKPTIQSIDDDLIDKTDMTLKYDRDNNKLFDDWDLSWDLKETPDSGSTLDAYNVSLKSKYDLLNKSVLREYVLYRVS